MLDDISALIDVGFSVIWLKERSKAPREAKWTAQPTYTFEELEASYRDGANVGVRLGKPSIVRKKYLHVFDMDVRDPDFAERARKELIMLAERPLEDFPTVISGSGGESRHFYFLSDEHFPTKSLWHTKEKVVGADGKEHWAAEIDLLGTGKQVVLPPSIHPDSGKPYRWEAEFDENDLPVLDPDLLKAVTGETDYVEDGNFEPLGLRKSEVAAALEHIQHWADDHETWRNVGMALKHEFGPEGWKLFDEWSKRGRGYNAGDNRLQYRAFRNDRRKPITMRTIMQAAHEAMRAIDMDLVREELDELSQEPREPKSLGKSAMLKLFVEECGVIEKKKETKGQVRGIPPHLLKVPGILGLAVEHYNATSVQHQPQFAVQTALALGSVVLARYWRTEVPNYTSLYFVNLGHTGAGKEFCRTFLTKTLKAARVERLMGPSQYTSEAAITGELIAFPRHVSVIDEFGKILGAQKAGPSVNAMEAQAALMTLWGALDSNFRPKAYSMNGKSSKQIAAEKSLMIDLPALSLVGLSTPETFFDALGQEDVASGFMNRLLVVNTRMPEQPNRFTPWSSPPKPLVRWIRENVLPEELQGFLESEFDRDAEGGNPYGEEINRPAEATLVPFHPDCYRMFDEAWAYISKEKETLRPMRLDGLWVRAIEIAMRISLIVSISMNRRNLEVKPSDFAWAWDYVRFYTAELVENAKDRLGATPVSKVAEHMAEVIDQRERKGMTVRDMAKTSREFRTMSSRDKEEVLRQLVVSHNVEEVEIRGEKGGRPTKRYLPKDIADELMSRSRSRQRDDDLA